MSSFIEDCQPNKEPTLSPKELQTKISEAAEKIQSLSWSLQENLIDTYVNFTVTKSLEQINYRNRKENLYNTYEEISRSYDVCENRDSELRKSFNKLSESFRSMEQLFTAVEAKRILEQANHEFTRFQYSDAMLKLTNLRKELKSLCFEGNLKKACQNIIAQAENQYSLYSAEVHVEWEDIFNWTEKLGVYHLTYSLSVQQSDPVLIKNLLKTLYQTGRLNYQLGLFSDFFLNKLLNSIIKHNCDIFTEDIIAPNHTFVFNIKINLEDESKPSFQSIFNNLMAVFDFLETTLGSHFEADVTFIEIFANSIRKGFFNKIIEDCIRNNLPSCDSTYQNYKNLVLELDIFNKYLVDIHFVKSEDSPLNEFVKDTQCVLYNKKCDKLLYDVRELLNKSLSHGTITVGTTVKDDECMLDMTEKDWDGTKPLYLPTCTISGNVKQILTMIVEHLEESVKLPERYSNQLVSYIRNIAIIYQSIVPKKFEVNLKHCPYDIALFFNNCFFLAHGLLGPPWKVILPAQLAENLTTVLIESIQDLRVLGLEKMSLYLQNQKNQIVKEILSEDTKKWSQDTFEQYVCAINKALTLMKDLKQQWHPILPLKMYEMSLCTLVQALCEASMQRVLGINEMVNEQLIYMMALRLDDVVQDVSGLFDHYIDLEKKIDVWAKFKKMPCLLKAQMYELTQLWKKKNELSPSFTCEEVRQVIKMRFPDDKHRLKVLMEIQ